MQLTIERSALLKALGHVQSVVERRNTIPILSNVLLSAGRDKLAFAATDLDMEMVDEAEAQVNVEGQITAPAHTLYEIVRKLPDGAEVSLSYNGEHAEKEQQAGNQGSHGAVFRGSEGQDSRRGVQASPVHPLESTRMAPSPEYSLSVSGSCLCF